MGVLPYCWEIVRETNHVEYHDEEGYSVLRTVLRSPVQYTVFHGACSPSESRVAS